MKRALGVNKKFAKLQLFYSLIIFYLIKRYLLNLKKKKLVVI